MENAEINTVQNGDHLIVRISGRLTAACATDFKNKFIEQTCGFTHLILDLADLVCIDSTGLGALVFLLQQTADRGGDLKLANLHGTPKIVFDITKANRIFKIHNSVEEALRA